MKVCDDIVTLIPTLRPALGQVLLSHKTLHKTGLNTIVDYLCKLRHGISYTATRFSENKWAKWSSNKPPIITLNIHKDITTTHIVNIFDRNNINLNSPETHNTNSVLILNCFDDQQFSHGVYIEPNYDFSRKDNKSFKAETTSLLNINFKRGILKPIPSIMKDDQNKEFHMSSKKTLGCVLLRDNRGHPSELKVPA